MLSIACMPSPAAKGQLPALPLPTTMVSLVISVISIQMIKMIPPMPPSNTDSDDDSSDDIQVDNADPNLATATNNIAGVDDYDEVINDNIEAAEVDDNVDDNVKIEGVDDNNVEIAGLDDNHHPKDDNYYPRAFHDETVDENEMIISTGKNLFFAKLSAFFQYF